MSTQYVQWPSVSSGGSGSGVISLNSLTGALTLVGGTGITVTPSGSNITIAATGGGTGTVTSVSVVSANGFAGTVATATTTPAITLTVPATGVLKSNGTAIGAATAGTDYSAGTSALTTGILKSTTTTGTLTIAIAADFPTLNQNTTGNAATVTTNANSTGDVTSVGNATTLATVNSNVGSFGSSTSIPSFTVNGKGLITAASGNVVIAPAGTLSGTTLNSTVVSSSLTSVGTITSGTWNGTTIAIANGGTGQTTATAAYKALSPLTTAGDIVYENATPTPTRLPIGSSGQVLTVSGGLPSWQPAGTGTGTVTSVAMTVPTFLSVSGSPITTSGTLGLTLSGTALPVSSGGTGDTSFNINQVILGGTTSTGALQQVTGAASGTVLTATGTTSAPTFQAIGASSAVSLAVGLTSNFTSGAGGAIKYDTVIYDTASGYSTGTGNYTIPSTGNYLVSIIVVSGSADNIRLYKNGTGYAYITRSSSLATSGTLALSCTAGDTLFVAPDAGDTFTGNNPYLNYLSIEQIVGSGAVTSFGTFGSTPNSSGGSISSGVITLQPASSAQPGGVSTTTQTFAGSKTFGSSASDVTTIGAASSTAIQVVNGGWSETTRTITGNLTIDTTTTDYIIFCNNSAGITVTLPAPTNGRILFIKDIAGTAFTNNITIAQHASEKIEGIAASFVFQANWGSLQITSNGTDWFFI